MRRVLVLGLVGLLVMGMAGINLARRAAETLVPSVEVDALGSRDHPEPTTTQSAGVEVPVEITDRLDVLLVGVDSREGLSGEEMQEMGAGDHGGSLTDTIIWLQYLPDENDVRMVSFPRDLAVDDPRFGFEKINALHSLYGDQGPNRLVEEVEALVGADLDHYVEVNLSGFVALTDAIGGVEVCLEEGFNDSKVGSFDPGCHMVDGIDAGRFIRARHVTDEFGGGAYGRNRRQQYFIKQAINQTLDAGTLANPATVQRLVGVASEVAVVDNGLALQDMLDLANVFRTIEPDQITGLNLPVAGGYSGPGGAWVDTPLESADVVYEALRNGGEMPAVDEQGNVVVDEPLAADTDEG